MENKKLIIAILAIFYIATLLFAYIMYTQKPLFVDDYQQQINSLNESVQRLLQETDRLNESTNELQSKINALEAKIHELEEVGIVNSPAYDSGWINITDKTGQYITITHNLNTTDVLIDITGKTTADGATHQKQLGFIDYTSGWSQTFGGTGDDSAYSVIQTSDGGYALAGSTTSFGYGDSEVYLIKTDANENIKWNKAFSDTSEGRARVLVQTSDNGYTLAGFTSTYTNGGYDFWMAKTDSNGNIQWNRTYGGLDDDYAYSMVQTKDGGYALSGFTASFGAGDSDVWLVKTDANGNMVWNQTYGGTGYEGAYSLTQTSDGGYALAGLTFSFGAGSDDFYLVKTDTNGNIQWNETYGGINADYASSVIQTSDGGFILVGSTESFGAEGADVYLVKTSIESGLVWVDSTINSITLYRGETDVYWNFLRVCIWKIKSP